MKAEIISCGTELLLGEVTDTNTPYLARELAKIGVTVYHHTTVGDNPERLLDTILHAENRSNLTILSGGLGPTQDDITKDVLAEHLDLGLVIDQHSFDKIKGHYGTRKVSSGNRHQSMVIENAIVLKNDIGMAAGMFVEKNNQKYVLLPGPPNEFEHMVTEYLIPLLVNKFKTQEKLESRNLNFYGLTEAKIAEELDELIKKQTNPTIAIYAKKGIIDIRLTVSGSNQEKNKELLDQTEKKIISRIGKYFVSYNKKTIKEVIKDELKVKKKTLSIIEVGLNNSYSLSFSGNNSNNNHLKVSLSFSDFNEAKKYFKIDNNFLTEKSIVRKNEKLASTLQNQRKTDYLLVISTEGKVPVENQSIPENLYLTIIDKEGNKFNKKVSFNKKMYLADWVIELKISDFIRRHLFSLEQLKN